MTGDNPSRAFFSQNGLADFYVTFRTIIIELREGAFHKMDWETTVCYFPACVCIGDICSNVCLADTAETRKTDCLPKIYIVWSGTDKSGHALQSASKLNRDRTFMITDQSIGMGMLIHCYFQLSRFIALEVGELLYHILVQVNNKDVLVAT